MLTSQTNKVYFEKERWAYYDTIKLAFIHELIGIGIKLASLSRLPKPGPSGIELCHVKIILSVVNDVVSTFHFLDENSSNRDQRG